MTKIELYKCDGCGKAAMLPPPTRQQRRHYCGCHPSAPFYMTSVKTSRITERVVGRMLGGLARGR